MSRIQSNNPASIEFRIEWALWNIFITHWQIRRFLFYKNYVNFLVTKRVKGACSGKQQTPEISTPTQGCSIRRFQGSTSSSTRLHLQRRCNCLRSSNCNCSWSCSNWTWRKEKNIGINKYSVLSWSFPALFTLKPQQNVVRTKMWEWPGVSLVFLSSFGVICDIFLNRPMAK